jgi:hypothetical protein
MDAVVRLTILALFIQFSLAAQSARSGLDVGAKLPAFSLSDQNGKVQTFDSIKGANGAVLVFFRSADW